MRLIKKSHWVGGLGGCLVGLLVACGGIPIDQHQPTRRGYGIVACDRDCQSAGAAAEHEADSDDTARASIHATSANASASNAVLVATPRSDDPIPPTRLAMPDGDDPIPPTRGPVETPTDDDPIPPTRDGAAAEAATPEDADSRPIGDDPIPPTRGVDEGDPDSLAPVVPVVVGGCPSLD